MIDLNDIALFVHVVQHGSFSETGRRLGLPANTVSRRIQELEGQLDTRLMQRSTRRLTLTDAGRAFHDRCAASVDGLQQASRDLVAGGDVPSGLVRVAAPADFFDFYQVEWIGEFLAAHRSVQLDFVLADAAADLIAERIDVAFRANLPDETNYIARRLIVGLPTGLFASPRYLAARGTPSAPKDLSHHDCLTQSYAGAHIVWRLQGPDGREREIAVRGRFRANTMQALRRAALAGLGIALLPGNVAADIATGRLVPVLPQFTRPSAGMNVVYPSRLQVPLAVSAFVDSVAEKMAAAFGSSRSGGSGGSGGASATRRPHRRKRV